MATTEDMDAAIVRYTAPATLPLLPELRLRLVTASTPLWRASEASLAQLGVKDPYWAYVWAGGQALSRYVLDHPELVAGKRVLDFATGCGVIAIAAAKAGASRVAATEIDPLAIRAAHANAALNDVELELMHADVIDDPCVEFDVVLAGDVFFERNLAARCLRWLTALAERGVQVLVGDPGRYHLPRKALKVCASYALPESDAIEDEGVRRADVLMIAR